MTALDLLQQLHEYGVILTPYPDGTLRYKAPKGVLTPALVDGMRQHKTALHDLVEEWNERAAVAEYEGGLSRAEAERLAWQYLVQEESSHASHAAHRQHKQTKVYHRHQRTEWETPQAFFDTLNEEFHEIMPGCPTACGGEEWHPC